MNISLSISPQFVSGMVVSALVLYLGWWLYSFYKGWVKAAHGDGSPQKIVLTTSKTPLEVVREAKAARTKIFIVNVSVSVSLLSILFERASPGTVRESVELLFGLVLNIIKLLEVFLEVLRQAVL